MDTVICGVKKENSTRIKFSLSSRFINKNNESPFILFHSEELASHGKIRERKG